MSEIVSGALKEMGGAAGAAISVLMGTVSILAGAVVVLYKRNNSTIDETTKARIAERDVFAKLIGDTNTALNGVIDVNEQRNRVTEELSDAIKSQGTTFAIVNERVSLYHTDNKEKLKEVHDVVGSMADAVRVNTGMVTEVRNGQLAIAQKLDRRRS